MRVFLPPIDWLGEYQLAWLRSDVAAGVTLAAYAVPVALAYATLAGLLPQVGVYGYILGGLGYALLGSSRHLAIGPTSAISLMIAAYVGEMAGGDAARYAEIASLAAFAVAVLCAIAWAFRLSVLVKLISDSILVGFKAGAGITIAVTQLPALFGVTGGGHSMIDRIVMLSGQLPGLSTPTVMVVWSLSRCSRRRAAAAWATCGARYRGALDRSCEGDRPRRLWRNGDRIDPGGPAGNRLSNAAAARGGRHPSTRGRLPAAGLHRGRIGGARLRREARVRARLAPGIPRYRCGEPDGRPRAWLSGGRRPVAIRGCRERRIAHPAHAGFRLSHPRSLPAIPDGTARQSAEGDTGRRGAHSRGGANRHT